MAFGLDDLFFILASAASAKQIATKPPEGPDQPGSIPAGSAPSRPAEALFGVNPPQKAAPEQIGLDTAGFEKLIASLANVGPAPVVPLNAPNIPVPQVVLPASATAGPQQVPAPQPVGPPSNLAPTPATSAQPKQDIGGTLSAISGALESTSGLLNPPNLRDVAAPIAGGGLGQVVPGFNLPEGLDIGALLQLIPRFR